VISADELEREVRRQLGDGWDRSPQATPEPPPPRSRASVVVPTNFARPAELRRCLKTLAELDHPDYEVIVVDNRPAGAQLAGLEGARVVREWRQAKHAVKALTNENGHTNSPGRVAPGISARGARAHNPPPTGGWPASCRPGTSS
jgi:cellulose synthase/poly-beta-1,6-N-acetylglucosamine synthase-like glycosyltransferase